MDKVGPRIDAQYQTCDNTQCTCGANKQVLEIIATTGFAHRTSQRQDFAAGQYNIHLSNILSHPTIAYGCSAAGIGCCHAPQRRVCPWIDREEKSCLLQCAM